MEMFSPQCIQEKNNRTGESMIWNVTTMAEIL